nr:peptidylprolyl isomerase [uncultured Desulfuromonas sp.]
MFVAKKGDTIKVHYTGTLSDGTVFDTSTDKDPLSFIIGKQEVIEGFDDAVVGMVRGETKTVIIPAEKAYGPTKKSLIETIERRNLPDNINYQIGSQIEVTNKDGSLFYVMVAAANDEQVTLDANHPLAGKELTFEIHVEEITPKKAVENNPLDEILGRPDILK